MRFDGLVGLITISVCVLGTIAGTRGAGKGIEMLAQGT
jgi:hypothetical protein